MVFGLRENRLREMESEALYKPEGKNPGVLLFFPSAKALCGSGTTEKKQRKEKGALPRIGKTP